MQKLQSAVHVLLPFLSTDTSTASYSQILLNPLFTTGNL